MAETILVHFRGLDDSEPEWLVFSQPGAKIRTGLDRLKSKAATRIIYALIPGSGFSCHQLGIKTRNRKKILQAAKFALDDKALDNLDDLFIAVDNKDDARIWLAQSSLLEKWLQHFNDLGLDIDFLAPETALLAPESTDYALWLTDYNKGILHDGLNFVELSGDNIQQVLANILPISAPLAKTDLFEDEQPEPVKVKVHVLDEAMNVDLQDTENIEFDFINYPGKIELLEVIAQKLNPANVINLLQGKYARADDFLEKIRPWRATAALVLLLLALKVMILAYNVNTLGETRSSLNRQIQKLYSFAYPGQDLPDDPVLTIKDRIGQLGSTNSPKKTLVSGLLSDLRPLTGRGIKIESITFVNSVAKVELSATDIDMLERLLGRINVAKYRSRLLSVAEKNNKTQGVLEVSFL